MEERPGMGGGTRREVDRMQLGEGKHVAGGSVGAGAEAVVYTPAVEGEQEVAWEAQPAQEMVSG